MKPTSIFQRLALFTVGVVAAAMSLSFAVVWLIPPPEPGRMNIDEMAHALNELPSSVIDVRSADAPPEGISSDLIRTALAAEMGKPQGQVRAVWRGLPGSIAGRGQAVMLIGGKDVLVEARANGFTMQSGEGAALSTSTLVPLFEAAVRLPDGSWRVGIPRDPERRAWRARILTTYLVGILVLTPLAWMLARRIADPAVRLGVAAHRAAPGDPSPFPVEGPRELRTTAEAMNAMHARLREANAEQARVFAALAHDLRTPLTALRLRAEDLTEPLRSRFVSDLNRVAQMASELLDRTELAGVTARLELVDLTATIRSWCSDWQETGAPVTFTSEEVIEAQTDAALLRRAVDNLIDNAVRYGNCAEVSVSREGQEIGIAIQDHGPGIPNHLVRDVLKPYVRLEPSRNRDGGSGGTGLGLSIAHDIALALGARVQLSNGFEGLRASIFLPGNHKQAVGREERQPPACDPRD